MGETPLHKHLKFLSMRYLWNHNCHFVATEVYVNRWRNTLDERLEFYEREGRRYYIDVLGCGIKPIFETKHYSSGYPYKRKIGEEEIVKGIEVKVSRSDFSKKFIWNGLNYAYVCVPQNLIKKQEVPKEVGILECVKGHRYNYLYVLKRPVFQSLKKDVMDDIKNSIIKRQNGLLRNLVHEKCNEILPS